MKATLYGIYACCSVVSTGATCEIAIHKSKLFDNQKEVTMSERDVVGALFVGFILGGLTGALAALLFAPQSGQETRALIKDKSIELRDRAQSSAEGAIARAEVAMDSVRSKIKRTDEISETPATTAA
jgi:gas vesicle protein